MSKLISLCLFTFISFSLLAQKNIIVTIGDHQFTKGEYEQIYRKNNTQLNDASEVKTPTEYLNLFVDYKLKVIEAENRGMDTIKAFIDELNGYRDELAKPYLTDITVTDSMVKQAYYRTVHEVRASHILLNVSKNATPEDTLKVYNRIIELRNQAINKEKPFEELAFEYSDDRSAKQNKGDLGYFKAFNMITDFENAAYETPVGEISMPIRTIHGYHIIYVTDLQTIDTEVKVAHIMRMFKNRENTEQEEIAYTKELDSILIEIEKGADFGLLAKEHSDDNATSSKKGEMNWINKLFKVKEFGDAAFSLKEIGDITKPIRSPYGMHILKLIDRRNVQSFEDLEEGLTKKVKNDPDRSKHSKQSFYNKKRAELGFIEYKENIEILKKYLNNTEDSIYANLTEDIKSLPLYKVADSVFTVESFFDRQRIKKNNNSKFKTKIVLLNLENLYKDEVIDIYEKSVLENNYPEFAQVMQEYHDGMLLFSIMQEEVWDKAVQDTIGLNDYYNANKNKHLWGDYFSGLYIRCYNQPALDSCKKLLEAGINDPNIIRERINDKTTVNIKVDKDKWEKGDNDKVDHLVFDGPEPLGFIAEMEFMHGELIKAGTPKELEEAKGLFISDYQEVLEDQWIQYLRNKYKVKANKKLLKNIESL